MSWKFSISRHVRGFRFVFDGGAPSGQAMRSYLEKNYAELKTINPQTQFLIREAKTTRPRLFANYDMGEEREVDITGMTEAEIERRIALLVDVGRTLPRNLIDPLNPTQHDEVVDFRVSPYAKAAYYTTQ